MNHNDQQFLVQKIRTQYTEKQHTELDELKELDKKVKRPAFVFGAIYGGISFLVMGSGMSLTMTEIGSILGIANPMIPGILIGLAGIAMALTTYPICKGILNVRKKKYAARILQLSENLMSN